MIKRKKGAASFGAEQKHTKINNIKIPLYHCDSKAVFFGRNSYEFRFLCVFLSHVLVV